MEKYIKHHKLLNFNQSIVTIKDIILFFFLDYDKLYNNKLPP